MSQSLSNKAFDYSILDRETLQFVQQRASRIKVLIKRTAQDIVEIGQKLIEIKETLGHGRFEDWLKAEFDWTQMTANRFMNVAKRFESNKLLDLAIAPSALYLLAAPSTPKMAREEALTRAEAGEHITHKVAQEIVKEQKQASLSTKTKSKLLKARSQEAKFPGMSPVPLNQMRTRQQSAKPEIMAVRPKSQSFATLDEPSALQSSPEASLVQPGSWWQLGSEHLLYCGSPTSARFQERLPGQIALALAFPRSRDRWHSSLHANTKSALSLFTVYQDQDLALLRLLVKSALELYTEASEAVVFSFLPAPELLITADQLGCHCLIAEPNAQLCDSTIAAWQKNGGKAEEVRGIRF